MIRGLFIALALALAPLAALAAEPPQLDAYTGPDAGRMVFSATTGPLGVSLRIHYKRLDPPGLASTLSTPWRPRGPGGLELPGAAVFGMLAQPNVPTSKIGLPDTMPQWITDAGGVYMSPKLHRAEVTHESLPPGRYEIYKIRVDNTQLYQDLENLAIPFEIKPGVTTYIGDFRAVAVARKGATFFLSGWYVDLSDQSARDLADFQAKHPQFGAIEKGVPEVTEAIRKSLTTWPLKEKDKKKKAESEAAAP